MPRRADSTAASYASRAASTAPRSSSSRARKSLARTVCGSSSSARRTKSTASSVWPRLRSKRAHSRYDHGWCGSSSTAREKPSRAPSTLSGQGPKSATTRAWTVASDRPQAGSARVNTDRFATDCSRLRNGFPTPSALLQEFPRTPFKGRVEPRLGSHRLCRHDPVRPTGTPDPSRPGGLHHSPENKRTKTSYRR